MPELQASARLQRSAEAFAKAEARAYITRMPELKLGPTD